MAEPVVAIVVGAGLGLRYGGPIPKPALKLSSRALILMSIEAMAAGGCTHAVVVINEQVAERLGAELAAMPIPVFQTSGGDTRQQSVYKGLLVARDEPKLRDAKVVLIHDAVRPMVPASVVTAVIDAVRAGGDAVAPAVAVTDSMRRIGADGKTEIIDRATLRAIQTPQGFPLDIILSAHEAMAGAGAQFTDDVSCAERSGHTVTLVEGSRLSMKITEPADLTIAKGLWKIRETLGHHSGRRILRHLHG